MTAFVVTFTETVTRSLKVNLDLDDLEADTLDVSDIHVLMDQQQAWDQITRDQWLTGDVEDRTIDNFIEVKEAPNG